MSKNILQYAMGLLIIAFLWCTQDVAAVANVDEEEGLAIETDEFLTGNIVEKTGSQFEVSINDSIKRTISTSHEINMRVELFKGMLIMSIKPEIKYTESEFIVSGLEPNKIYYKYEDSYSNLSEIKADENGSLSFLQDIAKDHLVFIQDGKSTKHIKDDATGGDCSSIGLWNASDKICKLEMDLNESVEIDNSGITFDGNNHLIAPKYIYSYGYGFGIFISGKTNVTIENITVRGFGTGVNFFDSESFALLNSNFSENNYGFIAQKSKNGIIQGNNSHNNEIGAYFLNSENNKILDNNFLNNLNENGLSYGGSGIVLETSNYNEFERNVANSNGVTGLAISSSHDNDFYLNLFNANLGYGFSISGFQSKNNNFRSDTVKDNKKFDVMINSGACGNKLEDIIGSGDRPIESIEEDNVNVVDGEYSELIMCGVSNNEVSGAKIKGSDDLKNNGLLIVDSTNVKIESVISENNYFGISLENSSTNKILGSNFSGNDFSGIFLNNSSSNEIAENNIANNFRPIYLYSSGGNYIFNNNFIDNVNPIYSFRSSNYFNKALPIGGNYWKSNASCTDIGNDGICDAPLILFAGGQDNYSWVRENGWNNVGASSVLFLPGIQSSRLYKNHRLDEDRLWEPTNRNEDIRDIYLNPDGTSVDKNIYTEDIIDEAYGFSIYNGFMSYMDGLVTDKTIKEWKAVPYDWRLPLEGIVDGKIKLEDSEMKIMDELDTLAGNSDTGKVTIIGHSNGGLLGKVIIDRLKIAGKENLVDKFIMVATPQVGTPKALAGLLHGDKQNILGGVILDKKTARGLAENMSSAYNLLPSKKYFDYVQTPVVEFEDDVKDIYDFKKIYGDEIGDEDELDDKYELDKFLTGDDGERKDPSSGDMDSPNVLDNELLSRANNIHNNLLDNWQTPENTEVIQIAGWGLDTIVGIKYDDCDIVFCPDKLSNLDRELVFKKDGDATVVIPSAIIMNDGEIYYVNVEKYNNEQRGSKNHASILEIDSVQKFIKNILNNKRDLLTYITTEKPAVVSADDSLRYRMHSPVEVHLYDGTTHTGVTNNPNPNSDLVYYEENIPNSYYIEFGETKYLGSPKEGVTRVELIGEDTGTFTFEIDELDGDDVDKTIVFKDVPVIKDMKAYLDIENIGIMKIDWNNDEQIDATINTADSSSQKASIQLLSEVIKSSSINPILKNLFLNELKVAQKQIEKGKNKVVGQILEIVKKQIEIFSDRGMMKKLRINKAEAESLIKIIETIRLNLIK